jgi:mannose-1-phosphate guanylyltransferase
MSGGAGTRLWPLSRQTFPKQLLPIAADESMLQASAPYEHIQREVEGNRP